MSILYMIDELREKLNQMLLDDNAIVSSKTIRLSQKLDKLITIHYLEKVDRGCELNRDEDF